MNIKPGIFKDYDIRAVVDTELDTAGVERIARSIVHYFHPSTVAIGRDMRTSGDAWFEAMTTGFTKMGVTVIDLGLIATDMTYYAAGTLDVDLAVMISASHNPPQYNGFKIVKRGAEGVSGDSGIYAIRDIALSDTELPDATSPGSVTKVETMNGWIEHTLSMIETSAIKPFKVVIDAGNGMAGKIVPEIEKHLPISVEPLFFELDGTFPNHLANPLLEETHGSIKEAIANSNADLGIMFDGDGDRMFLLDEKGRFVSGTITTAMVAKQMLSKHPGSTILYNAICGRVVPETIESNGGSAVRVRVGHTLIKRDMRTHNAVFAGEHSGHYYFRDNFSADSGLIAALVVLELMSESGRRLSELVDTFDTYPASGEINFSVEDKESMMKGLETHFSDAQSIDWLDGVSIWYRTWWANIRPSNTQPVLRLNVEADTQDILKEKTQEIMNYITEHGGTIADEH
jgi:phosphomannomutase